MGRVMSDESVLISVYLISAFVAAIDASVTRNTLRVDRVRSSAGRVSFLRVLIGGVSAPAYWAVPIAAFFLVSWYLVIAGFLVVSFIAGLLVPGFVSRFTYRGNDTDRLMLLYDILPALNVATVAVGSLMSWLAFNS